MVFEPMLALMLPYGACVVVSQAAPSASEPADLAEALLPEERALVSAMSPSQRWSFIGGRAALRAALLRLGISVGPILATARGAPRLPEGVVGSISHKGAIAVGLAARAEGYHIGVDLEILRPRRVDISSLVLTSEEAAEIASLPAPERHREVLLRFSLKEALYKAIDPFVQRY